MTEDSDPAKPGGETQKGLAFLGFVVAFVISLGAIATLVGDLEPNDRSGWWKVSILAIVASVPVWVGILFLLQRRQRNRTDYSENPKRLFSLRRLSSWRCI